MLALTIGFLSGRWSSGGSSEGDGGKGSVARGGGGGSAGLEDFDRAGAEATRRGGRGKAPQAPSPKMVFHTFQTVDPVLRTQLLGNMMAKMDANNFREMLAEVERMATELGREHNEAWTLMNMRAGQVAGVTAMEAWRKQGIDSNPGVETLYGWATADPDAARKWLEEQSELNGGGRGKLLNMLCTGAVAYDRFRAQEIYASLPEQDRMNGLRNFTMAIVDSGGREAAIEWMNSVQAADKEAPYTKAVEKQVFDRFMLTGAHRASPSAMVDALEELAPHIELNEGWVQRGMGQIRGGMGGLEMLDRISRSTVLKDLPLFSDATLQNAVAAARGNPQAFERWLAENTDSPIHGKAAGLSEE